MPRPLRRLLVVLAIGAVVVGLGTWLRRSLGVELDAESVRGFAEGLGPAGPLLFVGVVAGRVALALPSQVVLIAAGLCFGPWMGTLVGGVGLMTSGLAVFLAARYAGREAVEQRLGLRFGRLLELAGRRVGGFALALGTGYPIAPLSPIQAAAGLTSMTVTLFLVSAFAGGAARAATFAWFGHAIAEASLQGMAWATAALLAILLAPLASSRGRSWVRRWLEPLPAEGSPDAAGVEPMAEAVVEVVTRALPDGDAGSTGAASPRPAGAAGSKPIPPETSRSAPS